MAVLKDTAQDSVGVSAANLSGLDKTLKFQSFETRAHCSPSWEGVDLSPAGAIWLHLWKQRELDEWPVPALCKIKFSAWTEQHGDDDCGHPGAGTGLRDAAKGAGSGTPVRPHPPNPVPGPPARQGSRAPLSPWKPITRLLCCYYRYYHCLH